MTEPIIFSDLALVKCFHEPEFQSHQMAARHCFMWRELNRLKTIIHKENDILFVDCCRSLPNVTLEGDQRKQQEKVSAFVVEAEAALNEHCKRWMSEELLLAALVAKWPMALAVARLMVAVEDVSCDKSTNVLFCHSVAHDTMFDVPSFEKFLVDVFIGVQHGIASNQEKKILLTGSGVLATLIVPRTLSKGLVVLMEQWQWWA